MASWKDGSAYAPIERPDAFAMPDAEPLPQAEARPQSTAGAIPPPSGYAPTPPGPDLAAIGVKATVTRNPAAPFTVYSALAAPPPTPGMYRDPRVPIQITTTSASLVEEPLPPDPHARIPTQPRHGPTTLDESTRNLVLIAAIAFLLAVFVPTGAPYLFAGGAALLLRTTKEGRQLAWTVLVIAVLVWLLSSSTRSAIISADLVRWLGGGLAVGCVVWALSRGPSRDQ